MVKAVIQYLAGCTADEKIRDMKYFFLFILALIFSGAIALGHVSTGVTTQANAEMRKNAELISFESTGSTAVEVDGIRFEIVASSQILTIPANVLGSDTDTNTKIGIRITNNTSTLFRFPRYFSLFPTILTQDGKSVSLDTAPGGFWRPNEPICQLAKPGVSLNFLQYVSLSLVKNHLQLSVGDSYSGFQIAYNIKPGIYKLSFQYNSDPLKQCNSVTETKEFRLIPTTWQGEIVTPFMEFRIVP